MKIILCVGKSPHRSLISAVFLALILTVLPVSSKSYAEGEFLTQYAKTYISTYRELVEAHFSLDYRGNFDFYKNYPYHVIATISTTHGAALQFLPSSAEEFELKISTERIEQAIFKDAELSSGMPMFRIEGTGIRLLDFSVVTNKGYFVDVSESGSVLIENVRVDNVDYNYPILMKGSNREEDWSKESAIKDVLQFFRVGITTAIVTAEDFTKFLAYPELHDIAIKIINKDKAGKYNSEDGFFSFKKDYNELYITAEKHGLSNEFADEVYNFLKEQETRPSWWEQHPLATGILGGIVVLITGTLSTIGFRFLKKRYHQLRDKKRKSAQKPQKVAKSPKTKRKRGKRK
jgi:hypothetical protein